MRRHNSQLPPRGRNGHESGSSKSFTFSLFKDVVTFVLTVIGAGFAVYQFWWVNIYEVSKQPPELTQSCELKEVGRKGDLTAIRATVTLHNHGKTKVHALACWFNVVGARIAVDRPTDNSFNDYVARNLNGEEFRTGTFAQLPRHWHEQDGRIIDSGRCMPEAYWFEPDEEYTSEFLLYVPTNAYDLIRIEVVTDLTKNPDRASVVLRPGGGEGISAQIVQRDSKTAPEDQAVEASTIYELPLWQQENSEK